MKADSADEIAIGATNGPNHGTSLLYRSIGYVVDPPVRISFSVGKGDRECLVVDLLLLQVLDISGFIDRRDVRDEVGIVDVEPKGRCTCRRSFVGDAIIFGFGCDD